MAISNFLRPLQQADRWEKLLAYRNYIACWPSITWPSVLMMGFPESFYITCFSISKVSGESADMKRLRRAMQPRSDGSYLVGKDIIDKWGDLHGGGRAEVVAMWNAVSGCKDCCALCCEIA